MLLLLSTLQVQKLDDGLLQRRDGIPAHVRPDEPAKLSERPQLDE